MVYRALALKQEKKETAARVWLEQIVDEDEELPDSLIMEDTCLTALAKKRKLLQDLFSIVEFLKPWYKMV